jgi:hypothetical protein
MVRNPAINGISDEFRDEHQPVQQWPSTPQMAHYAQGGVGMGVECSGFVQYYGVYGIGRHISLLQQLFAYIRLQGGKSKDALGVVANDELYTAIAQIANAIK